ncbi:MAG: hypothetical protein ABFS34_04760 [Gemmatimonadota bacterium]
MRNHGRPVLTIVAATALLLDPVVAQGQQPVEFLTAIPETPVSTFLSGSPAQVERPSSIRDLGVAILSGVGADGGLQQGFAIDASLWTLIPGLSISLERYRDNPFLYALANTQLSLGSARTSGDSTDTSVALGLRTTLIDRGDPMRDQDFTRGLGASIFADCTPAAPGAGQSAACVDSVTAAAFSSYTKDHWNDARLSLAFATGRRLVHSRFDDSEYAGVDAWVVGGLPLTSRGQLAGQFRFRDRPAQDTVPEHTEWNYGARVFFGSGTFNAFAEVIGASRSGGAAVDATVALDESSSAWSAGLEFRIIDNTWITTGFGTRFDALSDDNTAVVFADIRWAVTSSARISRLGN